MTASGADYSGCSILIYDSGGNHLGDTVVTFYDKSSLRVEVRDMPASLNVGNMCKLLILSAPTPYEYFGRVLKEGSRWAIAMYKGQEKENRSAARYKVNSKAVIENLVCDGKAFPLHTPLEVTVTNISRSGLRIRTAHYAMTNGDRFQMRMKISDGDKLLIADVTNHVDRGNESSEYGCRFLIGSSDQ